ncbi:hypothetical protein DL93DRAFT_784954 [Clavulina sp. PMI_390]|nr:hypothetical protein DL93DRAFT_784954 [Clavulina sp. PMI_390]
MSLLAQVRSKSSSYSSHSRLWRPQICLLRSTVDSAIHLKILDRGFRRPATTLHKAAIHPNRHSPQNLHQARYGDRHMSSVSSAKENLNVEHAAQISQLEDANDGTDHPNPRTDTDGSSGKRSTLREDTKDVGTSDAGLL